MKKTTSLLTGSTASFVASISNYAARFVTSVIVARTLGVEGKGAYTLALTAAAMLVMAGNLGINGSLTYFTANKRFPPRSLAHFSLYLSILLGLTAGPAFLWLYRVYLSQNFIAGLDPKIILWIVLIFPVNLLTSYCASIILGKQHLLAYNSIDMCRIYTNLVLQAASAVLGMSLNGAILAWLLSNIAAFILACWYLRSDLATLPRLERSIIRPAFAYGARGYTANLMTFFNYRLDSFLVNLLLGLESVGQYSTGVSVAEILWYIPNSISSALFPKISSGEVWDSARMTARICRLVLLVTIPAAVVFAFIGAYAIPVIFLERFRPSVSPFLWLLPGIVGVSISKIISADLGGRGKPQYATYTSVITLAVTILLDLVLIPILGINGAAIASTIAYLASALLSVAWFNRETGISWKEILVFQKMDVEYIAHSLPREIFRKAGISGR